jgi:predicted transposase YbfD/YdcC
MLDVNFKEDGCRARKDNPPKNLNILRKGALHLLRAVDGGNG